MQLCEKFIRERQYLKNVSPATVSWYRYSFRAFDGALHSKAAIGQRIEELRHGGLAPVSINTYLRCIRAFLNWAYQEGHATEAIKVGYLNAEQKILATFTPAQIKRIVEWKPSSCASKRLHVLLLLLIDTGLRIQEALTLRREQVDLDNMLLTVRGKGDKHRVVPMSFELRRMLFRHLDKHNFTPVFCSSKGSPLSQRNALRDMKIVTGHLGITGVRCSFHTLRHTFALNYIRNGGDVFRLQRILGHTTLEMTRRYVNLQTEDLQAVHNKLSMLTR